MAELASGAVSSLLGLLRSEALLLSRVGSDSEFIKEEMESMHSFLEHLARTAPRAGGGGHDEQVRTWMKQVRDLAHDCSNCIDLYLRRGDPAVYRARAGRWRYIWWASWLVQRMVAQHNAAIRLRELKERARDVGKRRLRYGVEIPRKEAASSLPSSSQAAATEAKEEEEEDDDDQNQAADGSDSRQRALEPRLLEEYCDEKLANWLETNKAESITSIAIVAPDDTEDISAVARDSSSLTTANFTCKVWVNLSALHLPWDLPLLSSEILSYILHDCEQQGTRQGKMKGWERDPIPLGQVYRYKRNLMYEIWDMIDGGEIYKKIDEIKKKVGEVDAGKIGGVDRKKVEENKCLGILLRALRLRLSEADMCVPLSLEEAIEETASKLKTHMETGESKPKICLHATQYKDILHKVFLTNKPPQPQQVQEATTSPTTLCEDHIKEIIHNQKITLDIILGLLPKPQQLLEGTSTKEQATDVAGSVTEQDKKNNSMDISGEASNAAVASVITETKEKTKEVSEEITRAIASAVMKETEKMETSSEAIRDIADALVKETNEKLKELSAEVTSAIAAAVIKETKEKMKEMKITSDIAAAVIKEAKEKMEEIVSGEVEATSGFAAAVKETKEKMYQILWMMDDQMHIKGIVDKIKTHLENKKTLIILQDDQDYVSAKSVWEETRNALNLVGCARGSAVIVSTKNSQMAKEFCYPPGVEPITCSLVGLYYDTVLELTKARTNNGNDGYTPSILREILAKCHPHEFCMKIFTYALYDNPNRSYEELRKLHEDLVPHKTFGSKAKKMIKFSYKDLPREHKTCLLYLAIFPQGHNIKRSTLIGRWVTEGLITKQDWATAVHHAEQCFDTLIKRGLLFPGEIGAAGKVKSCMVGDQVHGFITKVANKEHILDARLSDLWARHFSIFSGLRLRASDGIENFVRRLPKYSPQLPLLKVLDLEGTKCFDKNHYLRNICNKILLLKYLSLRRTNVRYLPSEINNLHELEVLDIRQTMVPERATRDVLLLKLRRFLANRVDPNSILNDKSAHFPVQIPFKIEKMENLEVLSSVKASGDGSELKEIKNLWQLRKLGVVIEDRYTHLTKLLQAISDLKDCLRYLSVTISSNTRTRSILSSKEQHPIDMHRWLRQTPKHLESLSINGVTQKGQLLEPLAKGSDELTKVTLTGTLLKQDDLMVLAVLPKLHSVRLRSNAYNESKLTFKKEEFPQLKYFVVEGPNMTETDIKFDDGATVELVRIVLSLTNIRFINGIDNLPKLKELELEGNRFLLSFSEGEASTEQSTKSSSLQRNTESKEPEQNIASGSAEQNTNHRTTEGNTQSRAHEQSSGSRATEKNTEIRAGITQSGDPEQSNDHEAPEQDSQSIAPKENTEIRTEQNTDIRDLDQNIDKRGTEGITQSRDLEQSNEHKDPEQDSRSTTPKQNTEIRTEQSSEGRALDQSTERRPTEGITKSGEPEQSNERNAPEQDNQSTAPKKDTEIGTEQNSESRALDQNTERRAAEEIIQSGDPEQSNDHKDPKQDSQSRTPKQNSEVRSEQNFESRALAQNTGSRAAEEIIQSGDPEQRNEHKAPEQDNKSTSPKQITEVRSAQNSESRALDQNTGSRATEGIAHSRDPEQSKEHNVPEQDNKSTSPKQNTEIRAEKNIESGPLDENTESKAVERNSRITTSKQNLKSRVPEQNTQSSDLEQNSEKRAEEKFESTFTFKKEKFQHLKYFRVEDSRMINIIFENGAAPELKKIALSLTNKKSKLSGVCGLPKLKEIELKGDKFLLSLFNEVDQIAKITLRDTQLTQEDVQILAKKKNLHCLELSYNSYDKSHLAFKEDEFPTLDLLIVECPTISSISFTKDSAPKIERIVWSFNEMKSLSGIDNLPGLKEIECIGDHVPHQVRKDIAAHKAQPVLTHKKRPAKETCTADEDDDTVFRPISRFLKIKNRC